MKWGEIPSQCRYGYSPSPFTSMNKKEFKPYFDINEHSDSVIARAYQEERNEVEDLSLRVVHAEDYFERRLKEDCWKYNHHAGTEMVATKNVFSLMKSGFDLMIWISPKSDIYEEGRLTVMIAGEKKGELFFEPWATPLLVDQKESLNLGQKMIDLGGVTMDEFRSSEDLRGQPIAFKLRDDESWLRKCEELLPEMDWMWEAIVSGKVDENMKRIAMEIRDVKKMARGNNVVFELLMADRGYKLNVAGDHGGSWLSGGFENGEGIIIINGSDGLTYRKGRVDGLTYCSKCGCYYSGDSCPCQSQRKD